MELLNTADSSSEPLSETASPPSVPGPPEPTLEVEEVVPVPPPEDLEASPFEDLKASPFEDLEASPSEDLEASPSEDLEASPSGDLEASTAEPVPEVLAGAVLPEASTNPPVETEDYRLSSDDIDRIARRVVEIAGEEVVREIAWEVVPDMVEVVVLERLEKLESELEET